MIVENVLTAPVVTEKAVRKNEEGQYVFFVNKNATKIDIKIAFDQLFGRKVSKVRLSSLPKKVGRGRKGGTSTRRQAKRKAYITFVDDAPFELQMKTK